MFYGARILTGEGILFSLCHAPSGFFDPDKDTLEFSQIVYKLRDSLYLNLTNHCTNDCAFCVRIFRNDLHDYNRKLDHELIISETLDEINLWMNEIPSSEIVFCRFREPLIRLNTVLWGG